MRVWKQKEKLFPEVELWVQESLEVMQVQERVELAEVEAEDFDLEPAHIDQANPDTAFGVRRCH